MKRLSAAMLLLLLFVMFTIGGSMAYDNAVYGENAVYSGGVIQQNMLSGLNSYDVNVLEQDLTGAPFTIDNNIGINYDKWEPGYMDAGIININTTVAVDYEISLSLAEKGDLTPLADVIDVYYAESDVSGIDSRVDLMLALRHAGTLRQLLEGDVKITGSLEKTTPITLVFKMQENADNRYMNLKLSENGGFDKGFVVTTKVTEKNTTN